MMDRFKVYFEDVPQYKRNTRKGGKGIKMSKTTELPTSKKKYAKTRGEHVKDLLIAILITAILAFVAGVRYANSNHAAIDKAVQAIQPVAEAKK